jgi:hypothetical protein
MFSDNDLNGATGSPGLTGSAPRLYVRGASLALRLLTGQLLPHDRICSANKNSKLSFLLTMFKK